jgi:amino acid adenylation domain-containing protein
LELGILKKLQELGVILKIQNGDLKVSAPKGVLTKEVVQTIRDNKEQLTALISSYHRIPKAAPAASYPLTASQRRIWVLCQFEGGNQAYNIPGVFEFKGKLDVRSLEAAFRTLIERHESLRTSFREDASGQVHQYIASPEAVNFCLPVQDLGQEARRQEILEEEIAADYCQEFDLTESPLLRGKLIRFSDTQSYLLFAIHHIIGDGWSMEVLSEELMSLYNGLVNGKPAQLPALDIQFKDYAAWQAGKSQQAAFKEQEAYWLKRFSGELPVLELPSFRSRPQVKTYRGATLLHRFGQQTSRRLKGLCEQQGATLFMGLMAGLNGLFHRYTGSRDIILGTPVAGREHFELERQIGLYLNTLAIRSFPEEGMSFQALLAHQKSVLLEAYAHQDYPFDELVNQLQLKRDLSRSPLFDVLVVLQNQQNLEFGQRSLEGVEVRAYQQVSRQVSQFDLTFSFSDQADGLQLRLEYNTDIYDQEQVERMVVHLENLLNTAMAQPEQPLGVLEYISGQEREQLLEGFNVPGNTSVQDQTLVDLFIRQAERRPEKSAVLFGTRELTYRELDEESNRLAHYLLRAKGLSREALVGVKLERSEWLVISLLAVLKAGGAYVPVDPNYPQQRIRYIEEDSNCQLMIDQALLDDYQSVAQNYPSDLPQVKLSADQLAYLIYTSGSTGKPKGVMIEHQGIVNTVMNHIDKKLVQPDDRCLQFANPSFDASIWEILNTLLCGALLVIVGEDVKSDVNQFVDYINKFRVTNMILPPAYLKWIEVEKLKTVKTLITGGEEAPFKEAKAFSAIGRYVNAYGPTEASVCTTFFEGEFDETIPIGKPLTNTQILILSEKLTLQPIGVAGELCIGGKGLARGYLNKIATTAEKFIPHPFIKGERLYRTGDLCRWLPNGNIEFIGRKDEQVKVRGYRIELGEIENALLQLQGIRQAVADVREVNGSKEIVAYLITSLTLDRADIKAQLSEFLPVYMIPNWYIEVDEIPLTSNRKVNRKALPHINQKDMQGAYIGPDTQTEEQVVAIWQEVLNLEQISISDNFFEIGGNSLKLIQVKALLQEKFGVKLDLNQLFQLDKVATLAEFIDNQENHSSNEILHDPERKVFPLTPLQEKIWLASQIPNGSEAYNMPFVIRNVPLQKRKLFERNLKDLFEKYRILRTSFNEINGQVQQQVSDNVQLDKILQWTEGVEESVFEHRVTTALETEKKRRFDLEQAGLVRISVICSINGEMAIIFNAHHIIADQQSIKILYQHLTSIVSENSQEVKASPGADFLDYANWQNQGIQGGLFSESQAFWKEYYKGLDPVVLPIYKGKEGNPDFTGGVVFIEDDSKIFPSVENFCKEHGITAFTFWSFAWGLTLMRMAETKCLAVSFPANARLVNGFSDELGLFLNPLHLVVRDSSELSVEKALQAFSKQVIKALSHQYYPIEKVLEKKQIKAVDQFFILLNDQNINGSQSTEDQEIVQLKFPLTLVASRNETTYQCSIHYNYSLYGKSDMKLMANRLYRVCEQMLADPLKLIKDITIQLEIEESISAIESEFNF